MKSAPALDRPKTRVDFWLPVRRAPCVPRHGRRSRPAVETVGLRASDGQCGWTSLSPLVKVAGSLSGYLPSKESQLGLGHECCSANTLNLENLWRIAHLCLFASRRSSPHTRVDVPPTLRGRRHSSPQLVSPFSFPRVAHDVAYDSQRRPIISRARNHGTPRSHGE